MPLDANGEHIPNSEKYELLRSNAAKYVLAGEQLIGSQLFQQAFNAVGCFVQITNETWPELHNFQITRKNCNDALMVAMTRDPEPDAAPVDEKKPAAKKKAAPKGTR